VVCDGKALPGVESGAVELLPGKHSCSASRTGFASKAFNFTAKAGETQTLEFTLSATLPIAVVPAAQPALSTEPAVASAKPAPATLAAKPANAVTAKPPAMAAKPGAIAAKPAVFATKKKCGTTFLPCKSG
jgi:hypothetical protein